VTGFGLAGHLLDLLEADGLRARVERAALPLLPGAATLWAAGQRSTAHPANHAAFAARIDGADAADEGWLFDPQTSGTLLLAIDPARRDETLEAFTAAGEPALVRIGEIVASEGSEGGAGGGRITIVPGHVDPPDSPHAHGRSRYTAPS